MTVSRRRRRDGPADAAGLRRAVRRLTVAFSALMVGLFLVIAGVVVIIVAATANESLLNALTSAEHAGPSAELPPGTFVAIQSSSGVTVSPEAPEGFPVTSSMASAVEGGAPVVERVTLDGAPYMIRTDSDSGRVVQVAVSTREGDEEMARLLSSLLLAGVPAVAGAVLIAWWMSGRAMQPMADALAMQRRFVADAGHELRTPVTLLSTRAQLLLRTSPPGQKAGIQEIVTDARSLTDILEDLLVAADPRQDAERVPVLLASVADDVLASVEPEAASRQVTAARTPGGSDVAVLGTRAALIRLVMALVSNAMDHAATHVEVSVTATGREAVLRVADDGPGFPEGFDQRALTRFASARPDAASGGRGGASPRHYGLGLALVAEVAARHGGRVEIGAHAGGGAVVTVRFPRIKNG